MKIFVFSVVSSNPLDGTERVVSLHAGAPPEKEEIAETKDWYASNY